MGASLTMIDRHYGHLAGDGCKHAINLLDTHRRRDGRRRPRGGREVEAQEGVSAAARPKTSP
jgi:hypothetical protein